MKFFFKNVLKAFFFLSLTTSPTSANQEFTISVENIIEEFELNSIVAEEKFLKKKIKLTKGRIYSIDDSIFNNNFVSVKVQPQYNDYSFNSIICEHKRSDEIIRKLFRGMIVEVTGILESESLGLVFNNCVYESKISSKEFLNKGISKIKSENYRGAILDFNNAVKFNPNNDLAFYKRGQTKGKNLFDPSGAIDDLTKAIEINPNNAIYFNMRGKYKAQLNDYLGAINDYTKGIEIDPKNKRIFLFNRAISKEWLEDYSGAIDDLTKAIEIAPTKKLKNYLSYRGKLKEASKDYLGAIDDLTKAIEIDPSEKDIYFSRISNIKKELKDYSGAIDDLTKAMEIDPSKKDIYFVKISDIKRELKDYSGAIVDLTKAIEITSAYDYVKKPFYWKKYKLLRRRAFLKKKLKDYSGAIDDLTKAMDASPNRTEEDFSRFWRGEIKYEFLKDYEGGCRDLEKAARYYSTAAKYLRLKEFCKNN